MLDAYRTWLVNLMNYSCAFVHKDLHTSGVIPARRSCSRSFSATSTAAAAPWSCSDSTRGGSFGDRYHVRGTGGEYGTLHGTPNPLARLPPGKPRIMLRHRCQSTSSQMPSAMSWHTRPCSCFERPSASTDSAKDKRTNSRQLVHHWVYAVGLTIIAIAAVWDVGCVPRCWIPGVGYRPYLAGDTVSKYSSRKSNVAHR